MRQQGPRSPHTELEVGCIFPIAVAAAALVAVGVLVGTRLTAPPCAPAAPSGGARHRRRRTGRTGGRGHGGRAAALTQGSFWRIRCISSRP